MADEIAVDACDVCYILDGDERQKPVFYCQSCGAWLCDRCIGDVGRRTRAAWKRTWRKFLGIAAILFCAVVFTPTASAAQSYELICPSGSGVWDSATSYDPGTNKYRQFICVSATTGVALFNDALASNSTGVNASGNPTPALWPPAFGVKADVNWRYDATTVSTTPTVTCPDCAFVPSRDVGKCIQVTSNPSSGVVNLSAANASPCLTILSVNSATSVTASGNATASVTGTGVVVWGTDDTVGWQAVDAAAAASDLCPAIEIPVGTSWVTKGMWATQSAKCNGPGFTIPYTFREIFGVGPNESYIFVGGNFDYTTCLAVCFGGTANAINQLHDFSIWAAGINNQCSGTNGKIGLAITGFEASGILVEGWCPNATGFTAVKMLNQQVVANVIGILDAGGIGLDVAKSQAEIHNGTFQGGEILIEALGSLTCIQCNNAGTYGGNPGVDVSGVLYSHDSIWQSPGSENAIQVESGGVAFLQNDQVGLNVASSAGLVIENGGAAHAINTAFAGGSGSWPIFSFASGKFFDEGGNTTSGAGANSLSGPYFGDLSTKALKIVAANLVLSGGWGTTAAWTSLSGYSSWAGTLTASGTGQGATPTIGFTFPTQYFAAPQFCVITILGTTQVTPGSFSPSGLTATGVNFVYSGTPTLGAVFNLKGDCYN